MLADLCDLQEDYNKAETLYFQAMQDNRNNVFVLNNLAWLLAFKEDGRADALRLINEAIEQVGPSAELLDTRAVIHMKMKNITDAIKDAQAATEQGPTGSRYFHLAQALALANQPGKARIFLVEKAIGEFGLKDSDLHAYERPAYRGMYYDFAPQKKR